VLNKCDLPAAVSIERLAGVIRTSAIRGEGLEDLRREIASRLAPSPPRPGEAVPFLFEQARALIEVLRLLRSNRFAAAHGLLAGPPFSRADAC
jgi:hypothetical protein